MNRTRQFVKRHRATLVLSALVLAVGIFVVMAVVGRGPDPRIEAIRKQGYPVDCAELDAWYASVPSDQNPAAAYESAFELLKADQEDFSDKRWAPPGGVALGPADREELAALLADRTEALEALHQAPFSDQSRYSIDLKQGFAVVLPHLGPMKKAVMLLSAEALLHSENGESDKAIQSLLSAGRVAESVGGEPLVMSELLRISCWNIILSRLERVLARQAPSPPQLAAMQKALGGAQRPKSLVRALAGERAMGISVFEDPQTRLLALSGGRPPGGGGERFRMNALVCLLKSTGFWQKDRTFYLDAMGKTVATAELQYPERFQRQDRTLSFVPPSKFYLFSNMMLPSLPKLLLKDALFAARVRAAETALAVERYRSEHGGALPGALGDLSPAYMASAPLDPYNGAPLRFRKSGKGYSIYSVGSNGLDDGAPPVDPRKSQTPPDVVFLVGR